MFNEQNTVENLLREIPSGDQPARKASQVSEAPHPTCRLDAARKVPAGIPYPGLIHPGELTTSSSKITYALPCSGRIPPLQPDLNELRKSSTGAAIGAFSAFRWPHPRKRGVYRLAAWRPFHAIW